MHETEKGVEGGRGRKLVAVMLTDIAGFTSLTQRSERLALQLLERHQNLIRPIIAQHKGREIKTMGDAFLVEFNSALDAALSAIDILKSIQDYNAAAKSDEHVHLRIGIHLGDVEQLDSDVFGDAVNTVSRIEPLAEPDGICISQQVFDQVRNKITCASLGSRQLKGIEYPITIYRILGSDTIAASQRPFLDKMRIAVMPFMNISPDSKDEYLADGLTEELISRLSTVNGLRVIARTSVMRFKNANKSVSEIGGELRSGTLLEGSVRKAGNQLRVTAQLIDVQSEEHLWVETYDRQLEDVFAIQTELAKKVTEGLTAQLLVGAEKRLTSNVEAYALYLKGRYCWNDRSLDSLKKAIRYFEEAVERDNHFAHAYSGLADCYIVLVDHGYMPPREGYDKARKALAIALDLDNSLVEAHASLGNLLSKEWKWRAADEEFSRAIELNPNYAKAHHWYSIHLLSRGFVDEATKEMKVAEDLDPVSPMIHAYAGGLYVYARRYDDAIDELDQALELEPNFVPAHANRSDALLAKSMFDEALAELQWVLKHVPQTTYWKVELGFVYAMSGRKEQALEILKECEEAPDREQLESKRLAIIYSKLGDLNRAFDLLEKAFKDRSITPFQVKQGPFYDTITANPRFDELTKRILAAVQQ